MNPPIKNIWLFITRQCNLDCSYCYVKRSPHDIEESLAYKVIDNVLNSGYFKKHHVVLFGGEPLLKMELLKKIVEYGYKASEKVNKKITFSVYSNGTLMSEDNVAMLNGLGVGLDLSLDGVKLSHDQERLFKNGQSSFDRIEKNIPNLLKYYPNSMVHACITPKNVKFLSDNILFFENIGFKRMYLQPVFSVDWSDDEIGLFRTEFKKAFHVYSDLIKNGKEVYVNIFEDYVKKLISKNDDLVNPCPAGVCNFAFSSDGEVFPCHRFATLHLESEEFNKLKGDYSLGSIDKGIDNTVLFKNFINYDYHKRVICNNCEINKMCLSSCHWEHFYKNKNYEDINDAVCSVQKMLYSEVGQFLKDNPDIGEINFLEKYKGKNIPKNSWGQ